MHADRQFGRAGAKGHYGQSNHQRRDAEAQGQLRGAPDQQISTGDSVGCQSGGGANAVCTEFLGDSKGFSTLTDITDLRWVFELSFNELRQRNVFLGDGLRAAFVNGSGKLTAPIMSCSGAQNPGCPDPLPSPLVELQTLADDNGNVPIPGVPALLLAGVAGLFLSRRRGKGLRA